MFGHVGLKFLLVVFLVFSISSVLHAGLVVESVVDGLSGMTVSWSWNPEEDSSCAVPNLTYWDNVRLSVNLFNEENDVWCLTGQFQHLYDPCTNTWVADNVETFTRYFMGYGVVLNESIPWHDSHLDTGAGCYHDLFLYGYRNETDPSQNGFVVEVHHYAVPEPATLLMLGLGGLLIRKKK